MRARTPPPMGGRSVIIDHTLTLQYLDPAGGDSDPRSTQTIPRTPGKTKVRRFRVVRCLGTAGRGSPLDV